MADDVWAWCERHQVSGQTVTVKIKYADFRHVTRSRTLQTPVATREQLQGTSVSLVQSVYPAKMGIRLVGVSLSKLSSWSSSDQLELALIRAAS
jgi:DNA polymerase-4